MANKEPVDLRYEILAKQYLVHSKSIECNPVLGELGMQFSQEDLDILAAHGTPDVLGCLIREEGLPESTISRMYGHMKELLGKEGTNKIALRLIFCEIGSHKNTHMDVLEQLLTGNDGDLAYFAATNQKLPLKRLYEVLDATNVDKEPNGVFVNLGQAIKDRKREAVIE